MKAIVIDVLLRRSNSNKAPFLAKALLDTGSYETIIPLKVANHFCLKTIKSNHLVRLANGKQEALPYVGGLDFEVNEYVASMGAVIAGEEVVLGLHAMEALGIVINARNKVVYTAQEAI